MRVQLLHRVPIGLLFPAIRGSLKHDVVKVFKDGPQATKNKSMRADHPDLPGSPGLDSRRPGVALQTPRQLVQLQPSPPICALNSAGRVLGLHPRCRRFDPVSAHHFGAQYNWQYRRLQPAWSLFESESSGHLKRRINMTPIFQCHDVLFLLIIRNNKENKKWDIFIK